MSVATRLSRLERRRTWCRPEDCDGPPTVFLSHREGEPLPRVPTDAARCRRCGAVHVGVVVEALCDFYDNAAQLASARRQGG
jgi:hypothetical protein